MSVNYQISLSKIIDSADFQYFWNLLEKISKTIVSKKRKNQAIEYFWETEIEHRQKYISVKLYRYFKEYAECGNGFYQQLDNVFIGHGNDFIEATKESISQLSQSHCKELGIERINDDKNV